MKVLRVALIAASLASACGGASSTSPTPTPTPPVITIDCTLVGTLPCQTPPPTATPGPTPGPTPTTFALSGTVTDGTSHGILPRITIVLSTGAQTTTDAAGHYAFASVAAGQLNVTAAAASYVTQTQRYTLSADGSVDFVLQRASSPSPTPSPTPTPDQNPSPSPSPAPSAGALAVNLIPPTSSVAGFVSTFTIALPAGVTLAGADWTFGDGGASSTTGTTATHTYAAAGTYAVSVVARDTTARSATASASVVVAAASVTPPSYGVTFTASPQALLTGQSSLLTVVVVAQNGAPTPTSYTWDCPGDGSANVVVSPPQPTHTCVYPSGNRYVSSFVTITGGSVTAQRSVSIAVSVFPIVTVSCPSGVRVPNALTCTAVVTVNGGSVAAGNITSMQWNFGDGTVTTNTSTTSPSHVYAAANTYTVTATATVSLNVSGTGAGSLSVTILP